MFKYDPGTMKLSPRVEKPLHDAGDSIVMRHVKFYAYTLDVFCGLDFDFLCQQSSHMDDERVNAFLFEYHELGGIELRWDRDVGMKDKDPKGSHLFAQRARRAGSVLPLTAVVKAKAHEIAGKEGFKGFTLDDVKEIAQGYQMPTKD